MFQKLSFKLKTKFAQKPTKKERQILIKHLLEWSNLVFVGSFLQQIAIDHKINWIGFIGVLAWLATIAISLILL